MDIQTYIAFTILFVVLGLAGVKVHKLIFTRHKNQQEGCGANCKCGRS